MEEKDLNEMLPNDFKKMQKVKNIILGVVAVVATLIIAFTIWSFMHSDKKVETIEQNYEQKNQDNTESLFSESSFDNNAMQGSQKEENFDEMMNEDDFDKIINDMKSSNTATSSIPEKKNSDFDPLEALSHSAMKESTEQQDVPHYPSNTDKKAVESSSSVHKDTQEKKNITEKPKHKDNSSAKKQSASAKKQSAKVATKKIKKFDPSKFEEATTGSYLQVGAFVKQPNKMMQKILVQHDFRVLHITNDKGEELTKYLVGPFKSRKEASRYKQANPNLKNSIYYEVKN